ncbi:ABC transporter permease [Sedimentisphaera salicampi]|uniref:Stage 0 sporulation protein KC n=1 Tax=Sedimentisphaera salicampi TaxID=1941349 RepID=A0A1W6LKE8_9BACT|nr:ABC transporter permease [Sedimentisphaera salicampi]ARN56226.1 Stage 0 sporulation protein KC [Sedimentisphaera salicampi]OXU15623.1 Stage 0 sporulation protein KC [Sedimentisphaera salicampi]
MVNESINNKRNWGKTFGQLTWEQFRKNRLNIVCLGFIILLFVIAVFAPFIANSKPYFAVIKGELSFPLFSALDSSDYSVLFAAACCIGLIFKIKSNTKKYTPSVRGEIFLRQLMITAGIILAGVIFFKAVIPTYNSTVNYKQLVQESEENWAVFPPVPYSYAETSLEDKYQPPSQKHLLGTDDVGSDVLARLIHGSRISLSVGFVAVGISTTIGVLIGSVIGFFGGIVDFIGMRFIEIMMAIPAFFLILTIIAFFGKSLFNIMIIIGITSWTGNARFIRAEFLKLRKQDFVDAARALGLPTSSIIFKHILPNGVAPVLVNATFGIAGAIFIEAALSFLGFGIVPPKPSWGQMLSLGVNSSGEFIWWMTLFPGLAIIFTVMAYNLVGEGLRDAIDPKLRKAA